MACQNQKDNFDTYSNALSKRAVAAQKLIDSGYKFQWDDQEGTYVPYVEPDCSELDVLIEDAVRSMAQSIGQTMREVMLQADKEYEEKEKAKLEIAVTDAVERVYKENPGEIYWNIIQKAVVAGIIAGLEERDG